MSDIFPGSELRLLSPARNALGDSNQDGGLRSSERLDR